MPVTKEREILKNLNVDGMSDVSREAAIRAVVERSGIDFGRSVHCRNVAPNREWTNNENDFEQTPEQIAAYKAEQAAIKKAMHDAEIAKEVAKHLAEKELADLKAEVAALRAGKSK